MEAPTKVEKRETECSAVQETEQIAGASDTDMPQVLIASLEEETA